MMEVTGSEIMGGFNIYWQIASWVVGIGILLMAIIFIITKVRESIRDNEAERKYKK